MTKIRGKMPSKCVLDWALIFSILQSLTEGGAGGRVKEKVKPLPGQTSFFLDWCEEYY